MPGLDLTVVVDFCMAGKSAFTGGVIYCFLAEAQRTSMFILLLPQTPSRALRPGESLFVFVSRKGAKYAKKTKSYNF
jgi:hypothetical protein